MYANGSRMPIMGNPNKGAANDSIYVNYTDYADEQ